MHNKQRYRPVPMAADSTVKLTGTQIGGFLAKTAGTITVVNGNGTTIVDAVAVAAGQWLDMPFLIDGGDQGSVTLAGGASGTLAV